MIVHEGLPPRQGINPLSTDLTAELPPSSSSIFTDLLTAGELGVEDDDVVPAFGVKKENRDFCFFADISEAEQCQNQPTIEP